MLGRSRTAVVPAGAAGATANGVAAPWVTISGIPSLCWSSYPWASSPVTSNSRRSSTPAARYGMASSGMTYRSCPTVSDRTPPGAPCGRVTSAASLPPPTSVTRTTSPVMSVTVRPGPVGDGVGRWGGRGGGRKSGQQGQRERPGNGHGESATHVHAMVLPAPPRSRKVTGGGGEPPWHKPAAVNWIVHSRLGGSGDPGTGTRHTVAMHSHSHEHSHSHAHPPGDLPAEADSGPADPYVIDWDEAAPRLAVSADADAPWNASVAATLVRPADRVSADIGCGGGGMAAALAAAMTDGRVLAVDGDSGVLEAAQERLAGFGPTGDRPLPARIEFVLDDLGGDLAAVRAAAGPGADLVWASGSVHHAGDQQRAVDTLAGLLAPGGRLALAEGGLPLRCLPWEVGVGEPGLEIRLDAAQDRWFARMRGALPGAVPMPYGWLSALTRAGLTEVRTATWLFEARTPLAPADRQRVVTELGLRVERLRGTGLLAEDDLRAWARLLDEGDPAWLGHRDDLQRLTARSVHIGQSPD